MNIKCIALDLDGTTLYDDKHISDKNKASIERAAAQGAVIVVASGRCFDTLPESVMSINGVRYAITSNGAAIHDVHTGECLAHFTVPDDAVEKIITSADKYTCSYEVFSEGKPYAEAEFVNDPHKFGVSLEFADYVKRTRIPVEDIRKFALENKSNLDSVDIIVPNREDYESLVDELGSVDGVYITASVSGRIEITSEKAGKHNGLSFILNRCGISTDEAAAFGNADNDVDMLKLVKFAIAVSNATESCLDAAQVICHSNTEDGVSEGIEQLLRL